MSDGQSKSEAAERDGAIPGLPGVSGSLRETRMPAVVCRLGPVAEFVPRGAAVARAVVEGLDTWLSHPSVVE